MDFAHVQNTFICCVPLARRADVRPREVPVRLGATVPGVLYASGGEARAEADIARFFGDVALPVERTLAIIKPDATGAGVAELILAAIRKHGFTVVAQQRASLFSS
jgi:hypothetical protein